MALASPLQAPNEPSLTFTFHDIKNVVQCSPLPLTTLSLTPPSYLPLTPHLVQCSGSANKNIGDAFLLAWKLDDKMSEKQVTSLADQALVAFCKTLIELQRHQKFIMNFSVAAMERLHKRFPDYEVRIAPVLIPV